MFKAVGYALAIHYGAKSGFKTMIAIRSIRQL